MEVACMAHPSCPPVFIHGILQRSGTNFLQALLAQHPQFVPLSPIYENYLLHFSSLLEDYTSSLYSEWERLGFDVTSWHRQLLHKNIGDGLVRALVESRELLEPQLLPDARLLCTTPSVTELDRFFDLWPCSRLIILVRDGRDLAESSARSFDEPVDSAIDRWVRAADIVVDFDIRHADRRGRDYLIVRYEDLCTRLEPELRRLFSFLSVDADHYDYAAAGNTPVIGSSSFRGGGTELSWDPVAKDQTFNPLERSAHWSEYMLGRFNAQGAKYLEYFGYPAR